MILEKSRVVRYDSHKYDFRRWAAEVLGWDDLERLHRRPDLAAFGRQDVVAQIEVCRSALGAAFAQCRPLYESFVHDVIGEMFGGITAFQAPPSFRFHYSGRGSSAFHRDRDFGVKSGRLNAWVPLTEVWGENSIWIESREGKADFAPVELEYGEALIFDGANLLHGSKWNGTDTTRVSFDLRFSGREDGQA